MNVLTQKHNKTAKFLHLVPFLLFTKFNSLHPPMGCTHHTLYFIYLPTKLASFENLALKHSILHYMEFMCYAKLNTL